MFVFVFAKKLTRISLAIVLAPEGPSGNTKLAYRAIPELQDIRASLSLPFFPQQDPNNGGFHWSSDFAFLSSWDCIVTSTVTNHLVKNNLFPMLQSLVLTIALKQPYSKLKNWTNDMLRFCPSEP